MKPRLLVRLGFLERLRALNTKVSDESRISDKPHPSGEAKFLRRLMFLKEVGFVGSHGSCASTSDTAI